MTQRSEGTRKLRTVLFTDIVGSTDLAAQLGDERWRALVGRHHRAIRRELKRHHGREVDTAGGWTLSKTTIKTIRSTIAAPAAA